MDRSPRTELKWEIKTGLYAVAFLDLLGKRDAMREMTAVYEQAFRADPKSFSSGEKNDRWTEPLSKLREAIRGTAIAIESFFGLHGHIAACSEQARQEFIQSLPPSKRDEADANSSAKIHHTRLSDGLVLFMQNKPTGEHSPMVALYNLISTCAYLAVLQMADGHPLRGGIDVGIAAEVQRQSGDSDIYGPAFINAYDLESKKAEYARIVIGDGLISSVNEFAQNKLEAPLFKVQRHVARQIHDLLVVAPDGAMMIDFLGKAFRKDSPGAIERDDVRQAHNFVKQEWHRWAGDSSEKGRKLFERYSRLEEYFEARLSLWT